MNVEALCYAGLLAFPEALRACIGVLAEPDRSAAEATVSELEKLTRAELIERWGRLREGEWEQAARRAREATEGRFDALPPYAQAWVLSEMADGDG
jgi:hypothetical protein